jgi:PAS domain S-box-containing protein
MSAVWDTNKLNQGAIVIIQDKEISQRKQEPLDLQAMNAQLKKQVTEQTVELEQSHHFLKEERTKYQKAQKVLKLQRELTQTLINLYPNITLTPGTFAIVTDASTLQAIESELQQTKEQLRAVLDAMPGFVCWVSAQGKYLGVNRYMADTFNLSPDAFVGQELSFFKNSPELAQFMTQFLINSDSTGHQVIAATVNGSTRHYLIAAQKYCQDSLAVSVGIDITQRKLAEAQIQASLREKEVLLQEIHHRVKNNLQVISSLLDLQSQQIEELAMLEVFRESQNRVKSMALVHEKLYQSKNFARINFAEYTESLVSYLFKAYELTPGHVVFNLDIEETHLNIDTAIPCGLIINELVSNALKYAFPDNRKGAISISLKSDEEKYFTLSIKDDGVGIPKNLNATNVQSLGLQLVKVLTKQLKGKIKIDHDKGSQFLIRFSEIRS